MAGNLGIKWTFLQKLQIGINFGLGIRYNRVLNELTYGESKNRDLGDWTVPNNWIQKKGNHLIPRFIFGFKIGYKIR